MSCSVVRSTPSTRPTRSSTPSPSWSTRGWRSVAAQELEGALAVLDAELLQDGRHVHADGRGRKKETAGDLVGGESLAEQLHDLPLAGADLGGRDGRPPEAAHPR